MKISFCLFLSAVLGLASVFGGEGAVAVYIVDESEEHAAMGGQCTLYTVEAETSEDRHLLAIGKGDPGTTAMLVAYDRESDLLFDDIPPVIAVQTEDSPPLKFPAPDSGKKFAFDGKGSPVDLYFVVFDKGDPQLEKFTEYMEWLTDSLAEGDRESANLHGLALKNRISKMLRTRISTEYLASFGGDESQKAPTAKAAVTRGSPSTGSNKAPVPTAGVKRGLKTLDKESKDDARKISGSPGDPGILLFPINQKKKA